MKKIKEEDFKKIYNLLHVDGYKVSNVVKNTEYSRSTVYRVLKSKDYNEFCENRKIENRKYANIPNININERKTFLQKLRSLL